MHCSQDSNNCDVDIAALEDTTSECSIESISTMATIANQPGAGRVLGLAYDVAGKALERKLNKLGKKFGVRPRANLDADSTLSSISDMSTAPNLVGAGRTLDLLITAVGARLERKINKVAAQMGYGPDALASRLRTIMYPRREYDVEEGCDTGYGTRAKLEDLVESRETVQICRKLLKHAQSQYEQTRRLALQHIASLAIENSYIQTIFLDLGAADLLTQYEPCSSSTCSAHRDLLLAHSRKSLISLTETEVNGIGRNLLAYEFDDEAAEDLLSYVCKDDVSFLALRYLTFYDPGILDHTFVWKLLNVLVAAIGKHAEAIEWEPLDFVLSEFLWNYWSASGRVYYPSEGALVIWIVDKVLRDPNRFPRVVVSLTRATDVVNVSKIAEDMRRERLLVTNSAATTTPKLSMIPDYDMTSRSFCFRASIYWHFTQVISNYRQERTYYLRRHDILLLKSKYPSQNLDQLWYNLSTKPGSLYLAFTAARRLAIFNANNISARAIDLSLAKVLAKKLVKQFINSDKEKQVHAALLISLAKDLDRYCWLSIADALLECEVVKGGLVAVNNMFARPTKLRVRRPQIRPMLRMYCAESRKYHFMSLYLERKYNYWSPPLPRPYTWKEIQASVQRFVFDCISEPVMLLEVPVGQQFWSTDHIPVLATGPEAAQKEFIAVVLEEQPDVFEPGRIRWCTVREGASRATFWDPRGRKKTADRFWVLVLRFDLEDYDTSAFSDATRIDATGPVFWEKPSKLWSERTRWPHSWITETWTFLED